MSNCVTGYHAKQSKQSSGLFGKVIPVKNVVFDKQIFVIPRVVEADGGK